MKKIVKASTHPSLDCVCLDMEDGVGITKKEAARQGILHALENFDFGTTERLVRINGFETGDLAIQDLEGVLNCSVLPDGLVIPKVESSLEVKHVAERLDALGERARDVRIVSMIESPQALLNMIDICSACPERMDAVIFGADDYASAIGATRTKTGEEMNFARNFVLVHAAAKGVSAIDMVQIDYHDQAQLEKESRRSFEEGFVGKQIIHPSQIKPCQTAYSPTIEAVKYAAALVEANEKHQQEGKGAFTFEGKMIDTPLVKQHENLLIRARQMGLHSSL